MAEMEVPTALDVLQILDEKLKCSVCLQNFREPKSLPCLHAFCRDCLEHLLRLPRHQTGDEAHRQFLNCPLCQTPARLTEEGISAFPDQLRFSLYAETRRVVQRMATSDSHQVTCGLCNRSVARGFCNQCQHFVCQPCVDAHRVMETHFAGHVIVTTAQILVDASRLRPIKKPATLHCSRHHKPLDVYCHAPCDKLVCLDCTIRLHRNHECDPISEEGVFKRYKQEIDEHLLHTKQRLNHLRQRVETFRKRTEELTESTDSLENDAGDTGDEMKPAVSQTTGQPDQKDEKADQGLMFVTSQLKEAEGMASVLQTCVEYVEEEINVDSRQYLLSVKSLVVNRMKALISMVKEEESMCVDEPSVKVVKMSGKLASVGEFELSLLVDKRMATEECDAETRIGRKVKFILSIVPFPGTALLPASSVSFRVYPPETSSPTRCWVRETAQGIYEASYAPATSGPHQVRVRVANRDLPGGPLTMKAELRVTPLHIVGGLHHPCGVALDNYGSVLVTESDGFCVTVLDKTEDFRHHVTVLDRELKKSKSFGSKGTNFEQFRYPRGIAVTGDSRIVVSDENNHRIQAFNMQGGSLGAVGDHGSNKLQFRYPDGIAVDRNNKIFVVDSGNDRIQVMNFNLSFSHTFGIRGTQPGQFKGPCCVAVDVKGMVYVTDRGNHRVQKFTPEGAFLCQFGKKGRGEGELTFPFGIAIDNTTDRVYVGNNYKVSLFTTKGTFLSEFEREGRKEGEFDFSGGLAVDQSTGDLYVCDYYNNRLVVYESK